MQDLVLLIGASGSGKSYWCEQHEDNTHMWISRDEIRDELYEELGEELTRGNFYHNEKIVKTRFYDAIARGLGLGYSVFADATNTTIRQRGELVARVLESYMRNFPTKQKNWRVVALYFKASLELCLAGNAERGGVHRLNYEDMEDIYYSIMPPNRKENYLDTILVIDRDKEGNDGDICD